MVAGAKGREAVRFDLSSGSNFQQLRSNASDVLKGTVRYTRATANKSALHSRFGRESETRTTLRNQILFSRQFLWEQSDGLRFPPSHGLVPSRSGDFSEK
ncbi:hypothetical protein GWI33_015131 [Rhynchophorus ferrugineus]|uniref:Uncharacterized protein n=1 Tax=Rhynchophorus ferrugineus TaxID=354439 RepID=A0A834MA19_RHYFE|nr:hypothetical protein GWI33_015131 [Rhynchophorus ferrugineus]